jgi:nitroimidazol reductase NimA-like FMN-containing flavoprotein (pyridoxamine 5'-phosphate oxidase superfamily)
MSHEDDVQGAPVRKMMLECSFIASCLLPSIMYQTSYCVNRVMKIIMDTNTRHYWFSSVSLDLLYESRRYIMLGSLTKTQIDHVLNSQVLGRIGCYADGRVFIVPITYVYEGDFIYAHSKEGMKINMMRKNPKVCFEVDTVDNMANWRSVILWGEYEELEGELSQEKGRKIIMEKLVPLIASQTLRYYDAHSLIPHEVEKQLKSIVYRIKITERTGRYEKQQ